MINNIETKNKTNKILASPANFDKLIKIAKIFAIEGKYGEGVNNLYKIFEKVFTGNLPPEKVKEEIKKIFGFGNELCEDITKEMEREIFSNYKRELEELYSGLATKKESVQEEKEKFSEELQKETFLNKIETETKKTSPSPAQAEKTEKIDDMSQILKELEEELEKEKTNEL